jgi:hypothetical protein
MYLLFSFYCLLSGYQLLKLQSPLSGKASLYMLMTDLLWQLFRLKVPEIHLHIICLKRQLELSRSGQSDFLIITREPASIIKLKIAIILRFRKKYSSIMQGKRVIRIMRQLPGIGTAPGISLLIIGKKSNQICNQLFLFLWLLVRLEVIPDKIELKQ